MTRVNEPLADARDMFVVHTMFRREFGLMPALVRAVAADDKERTALVAGHVAIVSQILELHHTGEDKQIWPRLRERVPEEIAPIVGVMEGQHDAIHDALLQVEKTAEAWRESASAATRDALAEAIEQLIRPTREHLALEEERVVPLIEQHITQAEYGLLGQEAAAKLSPDSLLLNFGMVTYEADPAVVDMFVAEMPAEVQPVIRDLSRKAYAAHAEKVYGTATPPRTAD
jgi:hypothetical protein